MSEDGKYAWDFDRPSKLEFYTTFSVGIFQWQRKASGKGLKKSKTMSQVLGHTAELDRVYEKATDICARLNRERASTSLIRLADSHAWLTPEPITLPVTCQM